MTATESSVREAAARAWSLIADRRAGAAPDEPGMPLGIALDMVTDSGCERDVALIALRGAAHDALHAAGSTLPGRIRYNPEQWAVAVKMALHYMGAPSAVPEIVRDQLARAQGYLRQGYLRLCHEMLMRRANLTHQQWRDRADWLAWVDDARLAIRWLRQLAAECAT